MRGGTDVTPDEYRTNARASASSIASTSSNLSTSARLRYRNSPTAAIIEVSVSPPRSLASSRPRGPGACGTEAGVASCARSAAPAQPQRGDPSRFALLRVLVASLAPAADGAKYAAALGVETLQMREYLRNGRLLT